VPPGVGRDAAEVVDHRQLGFRGGHADWREEAMPWGRDVG